MNRDLWHGLAAVAISLAMLAASVAWAQSSPGLAPGLEPGFGAAGDEPALRLDAQFTNPADDQTADLFIQATIRPGWHIYSITQPAGGPIATKIKIAPSPDYEVGAFRSHPAPESKKEAAFGGMTVESHAGRVVWYAPVRFAAGTDPARLAIQGSVNVQPCTETGCLPPRDFPFVASLGQGIAIPRTSAALADESKAPESGPARFDPRAVVLDDKADTSMAGALLLGFLGGLILNLMPCVLPVIGLKIFSFVEQAGQSRRRAWMLNVWYSFGLLLVFWILAGLAAMPQGFGWGQLFGLSAFNVVLAAVVFAMGLSFLGVWEIPIPGFIGHGKAEEFSQQEGAAGAMAKGVLTTVLATPCSGPFLATALAWTVAQPPAKTFAVFTAMGLGMASPYLVIGAFPELIRFIPKPGPWMETFKHIMGFVLMGTVVYVLTFLPWPFMVPTVGLLFGIWIACWWIGRTPPTVDLQTRLRAWLVAAILIGASWLVTMGWLSDVMHSRFTARLEEEVVARLAATAQPGQAVATDTADGLTQNPPVQNEAPLSWQPFTRKGFEDLVAAGKTVMVDFTADWCLTCKTLEATVLNTSEVRKAVEANGVVPLKADWTHLSPEVTQMLEILGTKQVPVLAIFPAGNPNRPIRLLGGYRTQTVLDALSKAGPSRTASL